MRADRGAEPAAARAEGEDAPPGSGGWPRLYLLVLLELVVLIALFTVLTRQFA